MNKVRVEVFYQDNALQSIRIDKCEMEGLTAIENKPIPEWFMPVSGRASWKGLGEEVKLQTRNAGPDTQYSYYFYGPDMPKSVFAYCVQQYGLGEMVAETSKEDNAQVYLESAQRCEKVCDEEYYIGVGVETRKAFELFQKAAENGSKEAQRNLGKCYMKGLGVNKLPAEAVKYYKKAAEQGDAEAQYLFATCLFIGNAVTQNVKQAVEYYQKSAQQEYMKAINDLGVCYARGIGVPKDGKEALAHFGAASEGDHGFYVADSNMAYCYQNGIGVEKDKHRADVLYIVAEAKEDASRMSKAIKQMSRDVFAGKQTKTTMDEILKMNKSFERSKEKASNRKRLRMALEMDS